MSDVIAPQVSWERERRVARVVIGAGVRRNALTSAGWAGIERAIRELASAQTLRVVIIEGAADWFCAGSDIHEWARATPGEVTLSFARQEAACTAVEELAVPVIAKVRGPAAGAGCQLALACDMRILATGACMGMPITRLGILISPAFANRLVMRAGASVAGDLLYTGRMVGALESVRLGLANACAPGDQLDQHVDTVVDDIVSASGAAVRAVKRTIAELAAPARTAARSAPGPAVDADDFRHGVDAFVNRRHRPARTST
jgi:enoyl-CoA hydratase/carnithine racemase